MAAADDRLTVSKQDLARLRARPQSADQAEEMRTNVAEFVASIRQASGAERLGFNRWLLTREPAIAFRLRIDAGGPRDARWRRAQIELFVGGESLGFEAVPIWSDKLAIEAGSPGLRQVVSVGQAGSVTLVNTAWVDAFDSKEAAAAKLRIAADANRDLAIALQHRGGDLDGSKGAVIEG